MPTSLLAIAKKAQEGKQYRFLNLYRLIDEDHLLNCWRDIRKNAAYGVDRISARQYGENRMDNIRNLVERLKRKSYRARLVSRVRQKLACGLQRIADGPGALRWSWWPSDPPFEAQLMSDFGVDRKSHECRSNAGPRTVRFTSFA